MSETAERSSMIIESLDEVLSAGLAMLDFGDKKIIATHAGQWVYHFGGALKLPSNTGIYGAGVGDHWVVSLNLKSVLQWLEGKL